MTAPGLPCVHCGLCLDTCPTYRVLGTEADSPRGRIYIMEGVDRGEVELDDDAALHLSRCLGCLACESACPSGVSFGRRLEEFRPRLAQRRDSMSSWKDRTRQVYTSEGLVEKGLKVAGLLDQAGLSRTRRKVPGLGLLPGIEDSTDGDPRVSPLRRSRTHQPLRPRARAALLTGCVGDRLAPGINRDTVEVLQRNGVEVVEVPGQDCCGALAMHGGHREEAEELAAANARAFAQSDVDFVVSAAAGCGAMLNDYAHVLHGRDEEQGGRELADMSRDICQLLVELDFEPPSQTLQITGPVAYHDACHLLHARAISEAPRRVCEAALGQVPRDLGENAICCGSAGSYNLDQPAISAELGARKAELAVEVGATMVAVGNVGCLLQITRSLALAGLETRVRHPVQLLAEAYRLSDRADD